MLIHKGINYENEFNIINSNEKAYLIGLLYADGNYKYKNKSKQRYLCNNCKINFY